MERTLSKVKTIPTRKQKRYSNKMWGPTSAETLETKAVMERTADGQKKIIWYELSTNTSIKTKELLINYEILPDGVSFTILAIGDVYFDVYKEFIERFAKEQKNKSIFSNIGNSDNDGSFYGTGTAAIDSLTDNYQIHILNKKSNVYETITRKTGLVSSTTDFIDENTINEWNALNVKVAQTFVCKTSMRYDNPIDLVEEFKKILSITESRRILSKELVVKFNNEEISPTLTIWETLNASTHYPAAEYECIKDSKGNNVKLVSVTHKNFFGKDEQVDFHITAVGKRKSGEKNMLNLLDITNEDSGDRPYLIIRLKGSGKVIGIIFLRNRGGDTNLNRVVVEAEVERDDIIHFFSRMTKGENFVVGFEAAVGKEFRKQLEKFCYPAEETKEECKQEHLYNIFVNDTYGPDKDKDGADRHRNSYGIGFLNKLTPIQRESYVKKETKDGPNRYDIEVIIPKNTPVGISGFDRVFNEDVVILFENKKGNFKEPHIHQSSSYAASCMACVGVYGVGLDTSSEMEKAYKETFDKMQKSKQFRLEYMTGRLFDLNKDFFQYKKYEEYWRDCVNTKNELDTTK
jgi:hypothetical protein